MARTVLALSWAALASWGRGRAAAIVSNPGRPVRFWTRGPVGAPSPPLLGDYCGLICGLWFVGMKETQQMQGFCGNQWRMLHPLN